MFQKIMIVCIICFLGILPGISRSDDTSIFGGSLINIPPNVLIIFDNSGSMGDSITIPAATEYIKDTEYTGSYSHNWVYRLSNGSWVQFVNIGANEIVDDTEILCPSAQDALNNEGHWQGLLNNASPYSCNGWWKVNRNLRTGNYLNYYTTQGPQTRTKISIAKDTVKNIIQTTDGVRFGLMVFNTSEGGSLLAPLSARSTQEEKDQLKTTIDGLSATTWTPLAETLAEAGLYYARQPSYFNSGVNYANLDPAVLWRCQKNYVIIMTDGESTQDRNSILTAANYVYGKSIGDYDHDVSTTDATKHDDEYHWIDSSNVQHAYESYGSDYLDDVAKFLYDEDLLPASVHDSSGVSFNNADFPKQNIITYTIGFDIDHKLLTETADAQHGQGDYFTTSSSISLSDIFERIIGSILESNSQFISPVVPVNRMNRTYADNGIYLGIFAPDSFNPGVWKGNIKKFGFGRNGEILDRYGSLATNSDGSIKEGAHSAWVEVDGTEGMAIDVGGAGSALKAQSARTFKTYKTGTGMLDFSSSTSGITAASLGLTTDAQKDDLIHFVTATDIYAPGYSGSGAKTREWVLGDIVHSEPAILYDRSNNKNVIFVGANDGFLHCFVDDDKGVDSATHLNNLSDDEVSEQWSFVPWDLLPNLKYLPSEGSTNEITGDSNHDYFVDGSPVVYKTGGYSYVSFGLRRGGKDLSTGGELANQYFILNVSDYTAPTFTASISKNILSNESLGQSWSTPFFCTIRQTGGSTKANVLIMAGGYDTNQDNTDPGTTDSKGRAIFAVNANNGTLATTNLNQLNHHYNDKMKYCMVDLSSYDADRDGCEDVIYSPSVGGDLFVFESKRETNGTYDGIWHSRLLFQAAAQGGLTSKLRKFFYAPAIVRETWGEYVFIGSGDREHPTDTAVTNRFYAVRNTWPETWSDDHPLTDSDLTNVTDDQLQGSTLSNEQKASYRSSLLTAPGWYINFENQGEKVVSTPLVYDKVVYFTTFTPSSSSASGDDPCYSGSGSGTARLYALDYKSGEAVFPGFSDGSTTGDKNSLLATKEDRSKIIGSGIPSEPALVITEKGSFVVAATGDGPIPLDTKQKNPMTRYFWLKQ